MGLETATYISDLNANNPVNTTDVVGEGDDHLRLIKATLLNTFPNVTGAVSSSHSDLSNIVGLAAFTSTNYLRKSAGGIEQRTPAEARADLGANDAGNLTAGTLAAARLPTDLGARQLSTLDLGHASDTTLERIAAGRVSIEGSEIFTLGGGANKLPNDNLNTNLGTRQFDAINLGHASDTTLARIAAGRVSIEGGEIAKLNASQPFTASQTVNGDVLLNNTNAQVRITHNAGNDFSLQSYASGFRVYDHHAGALAFHRAPAGTVELYFNTFVALTTEDSTTAPRTTAARVRHASGGYYDIGLNVMPLLIQSTSVTLSRAHVGKTLMKNAGAITYTIPANTDTSIPDGATINILNNQPGNLSIALGSEISLSWLTGTGAPATGARTLAEGGIATLWKATVNNWYIWGNGIT